MTTADYSVERGYSHYRKSEYLKRMGGTVPTDFGAQPVPKQRINAEKIKEFLDSYANLNDIRHLLTRKIDPNKIANLNQGFTSNLKKEVIQAFQEFSDINLEGHVSKHKVFTEGSHITGANVNQLRGELTNLIKYLDDIMGRLAKGAANYIEVEKKREEFTSYLKKLDENYSDMQRSRQWAKIGAKRHRKSTHLDQKYLSTIVKRMEEIQSLFTVPSDELYWRAVEKLVGSMEQRAKATLEQGKRELLSPIASNSFSSKDWSTKKVGNRMSGLSSQMYRSGNSSAFLKGDIINKYASKGDSDVLRSSDSSTIITTAESQQTIDAMIQFDTPEAINIAGIGKLNASIEAYTSGSKTVTIVGGAPLTTILELSTDKNFFAHYMNIISISDSKSDNDLGSARNNIKPFIKKLSVLRGLLGYRAGNAQTDLSNVLFFTDGTEWTVYDSFEIARKTAQELDTMVSLENYPDDGIQTFWVEAKSPYLGARERVSKLYADIHKIKIKASLNLSLVKKNLTI